MAPSEALLSSRWATAQSKLPSKLPGAAVAVITRSIGASETLSPSRLRAIAPVCSVRMVQLPVKLDNGNDIAWFVMVLTVPSKAVSVPLIVPTALTTPLTSAKPVVVNVPAKVPTPGITCMIEVVKDPVVGGGAADAVGAPTIAIDAITNNKAIATAPIFCL